MGDSATFGRNFELLRSRWPKVAQSIEAAEVPPQYAVSVSKSGEPTLKLLSESGQEIWLHSRYRPAEEAERQLAHVGLEANDSLIVLGCGLGYPVVAAMRRAPSTCFVVVAEKDPTIFRLALENPDMEEFLKRPEVELVVGESRTGFYRRLDAHVDRLLSGSLKLFAHPASKQAYPSYYEELLGGVHDFTVHGAVAVRSALYLSRVSIENRFGNLQEYLVSPGVRVLAEKFKGYPAVVVAAGPSLDKNVEELRKARGRAVIIAVSTALKVLLSRGILPDLTAIIDYHDVSSRYFESIPEEEAVPIVCDPKANTGAIHSYSGVKLFYNDVLMNTLFDGLPGDKGSLVMASTVAHAAFDVARTLGCDPIITVGLDLSYPGGRHHTSGTAQQLQHFPETHRLYSFEMKEMEWYLLHRKHLLKVPAVNGGEVWTSDIFFTYLREFESLFENSKQTVIDATEGGALARGTTVMSLREALERYAFREIPEELVALPHKAAAAVNAADTFNGALEVIDQRLKDAVELASAYKKAIRLLKKVIKITERGEAADEVAVQVIALKKEFDQYGFLFYFLNHLAQADLFVRVQKDRVVKGDELTGVEKQHHQARRDLEYIQGLKRALDYVEELLRKARRQLKARLKELTPA